ncbi:2,3-bisphosphoglycerate-dependent phosphoglycerate mutase [Amycolatopsis tolypomycina]|uniref:phosphoglycerate mutase (2,3-diphosphoglycerate-dependent) n=1 Tax=Amycolatopsis tolypomycina TaxID=208445 RepID=A0A1H4YYB4_9PSEU|nr:histidine phosphatase family protein [Amycolatopsis tolypomycina]SED22677.1 2,3-bisphosphoglycerate-dependent phosphoglycerate mutase [Amycolatopsis tolypomycina]
MAIYFIRHGESLANERNLFAGRQNTPLTDLGVRQAHQAGRRVAAIGVRFDEVHVSPLDRAKDTARIIVERIGTPRVTTVESAELVERDFGVFTAQNKSLVKKSVGFRAYTEYFHSCTGCPPGGESWPEMYERVRDYYEAVLLPRSRAGRSVLVVAHKYVVEMFALVVAGIRPTEYRDLKIPNARPLAEADLRWIARATARSAAVHDFGEIVEIRLPVLVAGAAALGVLAQLAVRVPVPPQAFSAVLVSLLAISTFFGMLRLHSGAVRGLGRGLRVALPLTAARVAAGLALVSLSPGTPGLLLGLFLLLPPALITPTLSLLWDGDYFTSVRQTVAASLVLPVALLLALWLPHRLAGLDSALTGYLGVLAGAMALPALAAQVLRRRNPIRAGSLSTNWNWVGGFALVPLAGFVTFALTPAGADHAGAHPGLVACVAVVAAVLLGLRIASVAFVRWRKLPARVARDVFITQSTPNVFLWFAVVGGVGSAVADAATLLAPITACGFFAAMFVDEAVIVRRFTRRLRAAMADVGPAAPVAAAG